MTVEFNFKPNHTLFYIIVWLFLLLVKAIQIFFIPAFRFQPFSFCSIGSDAWSNQKFKVRSQDSIQSSVKCCRTNLSSVNFQFVCKKGSVDMSRQKQRQVQIFQVLDRINEITVHQNLCSIGKGTGKNDVFKPKFPSTLPIFQNQDNEVNLWV